MWRYVPNVEVYTQCGGIYPMWRYKPNVEVYHIYPIWCMTMHVIDLACSEISLYFWHAYQRVQFISGYSSSQGTVHLRVQFSSSQGTVHLRVQFSSSQGTVHLRVQFISGYD